MALTRKLLEGMGIEDKQVETIIEAHLETVNGLKSERDRYKADAEKLAQVEKELDDAKAAAGDPEEWHKRFDALNSEFEDYKGQIDGERIAAKKERAYRRILADVGIDQNMVDKILRVTDLSGVELEGDALKDADKLKSDADKEWGAFVVKTRTQGSDPATPPKPQASTNGADPEVSRRQQERYERRYGISSNDSKE